MTLHPDFADQPESVRNTLLDNIAKLEKFAEWHRFPARAPALADRVNMGMTSIESATKIAAGWAEHIAALQGDPTNNVTPLDGSRRSNASAMADLIRQAQGTMDDIREVVRQIGGDSALVYDLSTPSLVYESASNFHQIYGGVHGDAAVQQFTEALRDANPEWVPGSDWFGDDIDEVALYWYQRDPERAVQIAQTILRLHGRTDGGRDRAHQIWRPNCHQMTP